MTSDIGGMSNLRLPLMH